MNYNKDMDRRDEYGCAAYMDERVGGRGYGIHKEVHFSIWLTERSSCPVWSDLSHGEVAAGSAYSKN